MLGGGRSAVWLGGAARPAQGWSEGHLRIGWGCAASSYPALRQGCKSRVALGSDGALRVQCGTQDMGSGTYTALAQLAGEVLGIDTGRISVELGDTDLPEGPISAGSQVTQSITPSVRQAATRVRDQIARLVTEDAASPLFGLDPESLIFADGAVADPKGNAVERLTDIMARTAPNGLEGEGLAAPPEAQALTAMGHGAIFAEVSVDPDLGEVRVRRICAAFAAGRILNPLLARSQYVGGLIGGLGMALHEETVTDPATGRILGANLADYLIPVHADIPAMDIIMVPEDDPHLPGGIKGIGMLGTVGTAAAIANAVFHATGRRIRSLPIRLEDLM